MDIPIKYGYGRIYVNIENGIPQCPACYQNMELNGEFWECPIGKQINNAALYDLMKMLDEVT